MTTKTGLFLGCNMPALRPDIEQAIRLSLPDVGVEVVDMDGYVCCPGFGTFPSLHEDAQLATNAWNLSIAEKHGVDLLAQCGSCYSSLRLGRHTMLQDEETLGRINELIGKADKRYEGKAQMRHMTDFLYYDVGIDRIKQSLKRTLEGVHVVVQYPCHTRFPSDVVGFETASGRPAILRELVEALGATVDTFSLEYGCCGGSGGFHKASAPRAEAFTKRKLDAIKKETQAEAIVGSCITCILYLDRIQKKLGEEHEIDYDLPVFDYNQLLALCQDKPVEQVAQIAMVPREKFIERHFGA
jgi:heterodisulfide reductase subunit B